MAARPAVVRILGSSGANRVPAAGPVGSIQEAEIELPAEVLDDLWREETLERLARAYWRYLSRVSLGILRVAYTPTSRTVVAAGSVPLLRFRRPEYVMAPGVGRVTWTIERGILVAPRGRGTGFLRFTVRRAGQREGRAVVRISAEVANFYPLLRGSGRFARFGAWLYSQTQLRIHVMVGRGFLRSLGRLPPTRSP